MGLVIPKGAQYEFSITVKDTDSFLPKDLSNVSSATINIIDKVTDVLGVSGTLSVDADPTTGLLHCSLPAEDTATLNTSKGAREDRSYPMANYNGVIIITFSDATDDITVVLEDIAVVSLGV